MPKCSLTWWGFLLQLFGYFYLLTFCRHLSRLLFISLTCGIGMLLFTWFGAATLIAGNVYNRFCRLLSIILIIFCKKRG